MKLVMLVNDSPQNVEKMKTEISDINYLFVNTENCDTAHEYKYILESIESFAQSDDEIMLTKFSGNDGIVKEVGDICPEMIISLNYDKNSIYYVRNSVDMFLDLLRTFTQGDLDTNGATIEKSPKKESIS